MSGSKTTTSNTVDPKLMALYQQNYKMAQDVANRPYQPYTGELVAPFTPTQLDAQGALTNLATGETGDATLNSAVGGATGILGSTGANGATLAGADLSKYMNPFQHSVIDATLAQLNRQRGQQRVADNQSATQAGAFGGDRQGVADALTNQAYDLNAAQTIAQLNAQNYGQAQNAAEYDLNRGMQSDMIGLDASNVLAGLSQEQINEAAQKAGILGSVGNQQQQQQQNVDASDYQQWLSQWSYPLLQQQIRNQALGLIPLQQTQTQKTSAGLGGILGAVGSVAQGVGAFI